MNVFLDRWMESIRRLVGVREWGRRFLSGLWFVWAICAWAPPPVAAQTSLSDRVTMVTNFVSVVDGGTVFLQCQVTGPGAFTYQWARDRALIRGQTNDSLTIVEAGAGDAGVYSVTVSDGTDTAKVSAVVMVGKRPVITEQPPETLAVAVGSTVSVTIQVLGTPPLFYQWYDYTATEISGMTNATLTITNAQKSQSGKYWATVRNGADIVVSETVIVSVEEPPVFTGDGPRNLLVRLGDTVTNSVTVQGKPTSYRWYKGGVSIPWATTRFLVLTNCSAADAGSYWVVVTNLVGTNTSHQALVTVYDPPAIRGQPVGLVLVAGSDALFTVDATGLPAPEYAWRRSGGARVLGTNSTLPLSNVGPADAGAYSVSVSNAYGSVTSQVATLTVQVPPSIDVPPQPLTLTNGNPAAFSVAASGTAPLAYQWLKNGSTISGATNSAYTISSVSAADEASYSVTVANVAGAVTSAPVALVVWTPPAILDPPQSLALTNGARADFSVSASGTAPLGYQWFKDGTARVGANARTYSIASVGPGDAGEYWVVVSNRAGIVTSLRAAVTVNSPPVLTVPSAPLEVIALATVSVTNTATDPDLPRDVLTFQLVSGPSGARIDSTTGILAWTPTLAQAPSTNTFLVGVSDNATPPLGDAKSFLVIVKPPLQMPSISASPASLTVTNGDPASFQVVASGTPPLTYQWFKDGLVLAGQTNATLLLAAARPGDAGLYRAVVGNSAGTVASADARLTVFAPASLRGVATDALSKQPLAGVTVRLGNLTRTTAADGAFEFTGLPAGGLEAGFSASPGSGAAPLTVQFSNTTADRAYTLEAEKPGYSRYAFTPLELAPGEAKEWSFSLSPSLRGLRLVLNWGANPKDLDAHLLTPPIGGVNYHVQYSTRYFGQTNRPPFAQLDADETHGFGPETITIASNVPGFYRYYVHNYQEEQGDTGPLAGSDAVVQIYSSAGLVQTIRAPATGAGEFWEVCEIDGASGWIGVINRIGTAAPQPDTIGAGGGSSGGTNVASATYAWTFGDGETSGQENPSHTYVAAGEYDVSFTVVAPDGRSSTAAAVRRIVVSDGGVSAPRLQLARSGAELELTWRTADTGFVLESRPSLTEGTWAAAGLAVETRPDGSFAARITLGGQQYFRLGK